MAKYFNTRVKTGKLAGSVFAVRFGETIERAYQPVVTNPNTPAQIANRAKLKLMSQLPAVFGSNIAIPRVGAKSARNQFVAINYPAATYAGEQADVTLTSVKLTKSSVGLPGLNVDRSGYNITVGLAEDNFPPVDRVVYVVALKESDNTIRVLTSAVVSTPGEGNSFTHEFSLSSQSANVVIYAYGVRDNTEAARVMFGNLQTLTSESVAKLVTTRQLTNADVTLTETRAIESNPSI